ncbi:MAG: 5-bromo-4-chloroindolyl phosphate hydrolysis family protein [Clostridia bacterium]|nr:5-bromo-4-chloroindolyl phosphate hydrolysis family protein [Clostridia bacterium]
MSKNPKKKDFWWILVLVLIFAPGLIGALAKAALGLLLPLAAIAAVLIVALNSSGKKKTAPQKTAEREQERAAEQLRQAAEEAHAKSESALKKKLSRFSRSGWLFALAVLCYVLGGLCGLGAGIAAVEAQGVAAALGDVMAMLVTTLWFLGCGGVLHIYSHVRKNRARDAQRYATIIGDRESYSLTKLSAATSYKIDKVKRDLQRMIDAGIFGEQAYLDMSNLCFMRTPDARPDGAAQQFGTYIRTMNGNSSEEQKAESSAQTQTDSAPEETEVDMTDPSSILKRIRCLDEEIQDEKVSERIRRIETVTGNIFAYVQEKPEKQKQLRMFMNYYMPTTLKLLESYSRIERVGVTGQNMKDAKEKIEQILELLVSGFEQQFDQLYKAESLDIHSDIEVLEQMMKKDGLHGSGDFDIRTDNRAELEDFLNSFSDEFSDELSEESGTASKTE